MQLLKLLSTSKLFTYFSIRKWHFNFCRFIVIYPVNLSPRFCNECCELWTIFEICLFEYSFLLRVKRNMWCYRRSFIESYFVMWIRCEIRVFYRLANVGIRERQMEVCTFERLSDTLFSEYEREGLKDYRWNWNIIKILSTKVRIVIFYQQTLCKFIERVCPPSPSVCH